ncbi:hypothetical protein Q4S45_22795 [Massilia sp. R2A-15]|uniref:hypothetical protein n=1 Tax=Massilia sp. R2A-15 TaxID=3064278 RepID=UPI002732C992|nr:hypothetical protein [Massilia sp. R2A-15]WLI89486.1 hypothetical protein Q4S45_22795 [Massilia sp. R2A-15]
MKKLGDFLVIMGFGLLLFWQASYSISGGGVRPVLTIEFAKIEKYGRPCIPVDEVSAIAIDTAHRMYDAQPLYVIPGCLMLLGFLLSRRRNPINQKDE